MFHKQVKVIVHQNEACRALRSAQTLLQREQERLVVGVGQEDGAVGYRVRYMIERPGY